MGQLFNRQQDRVRPSTEWFSCKGGSTTNILDDHQRRDGKTPLQLIQEVKTRWNSTYKMTESVILIRKYIETVTV